MQIIKEKLSWVDILKPTADDLAFLKTIESFHPLVLEELQSPSVRSRAEIHGRYLFLVYHLPVYRQESKTSEKAEVDFLVTKDRLITVHYEFLSQLDEFVLRLQNQPHFKEAALGETTGHLLYYLLQQFNEFTLRQMTHIDEDIDYISKNVFARREKELLEKISYVKRNVVNFKLIVEPQAVILNSLKEVGSDFWREAAGTINPYLADLIGDHARVVDKIENNFQIIESLEETNAQLLAAKTNDTMKTLSIMALLTFPLALYTAVYDIGPGRELLDDLFGGFWNGFGVFFLLTLLSVWLSERKL